MIYWYQSAIAIVYTITMTHCAKCNQPAVYSCRNCTTTYCSNKCAQEDWIERHNFICMKKDGSRVKILILCDISQSTSMEKLSTTLPDALNSMLKDVDVRSSTTGTFMANFEPDLVLIPSIILGARPSPVDLDQALLNKAIDRGMKNVAYLFVLRSNNPEKTMQFAGEAENGGFSLNTSNQKLEAFRLIVGFNDFIVYRDLQQNTRQIAQLQKEISIFIEQSTTPSQPTVFTPPKTVQPPPQEQPTRLPSGRDEHALFMERIRQENEQLRAEVLTLKKRIYELEQTNNIIERKMFQIVKIVNS